MARGFGLVPIVTRIQNAAVSAKEKQPTVCETWSLFTFCHCIRGGGSKANTLTLSKNSSLSTVESYAQTRVEWREIVIFALKSFSRQPRIVTGAHQEPQLLPFGYI